MIGHKSATLIELRMRWTSLAMSNVLYKFCLLTVVCQSDSNEDTHKSEKYISMAQENSSLHILNSTQDTVSVSFQIERAADWLVGDIALERA